MKFQFLKSYKYKQNNEAKLLQSIEILESIISSKRISYWYCKPIK